MKPILKTAEYLRAARDIEASFADDVATVAMLTTFTAELLRPYFIVACRDLGLPLRPWFGPFQQLEQMVLDDVSAMWQQVPTVIVILARLEDIDPYLPDESAELGPAATKARLQKLIERLTSLAQVARNKSTATILVANFTSSPRCIGHFFDANDADGFVYQLTNCNRELSRALKNISDTHIFDMAGVVAQCGARRWMVPKLWYMARTPCGSENQVELGRSLARTIVGVLRTPAKCIVVDLDNTLWGGVLGDDGAEGIQLGNEYPGNVFKDVQAAILGYRRRGFLLAISSKNNESTVLNVLDTHPEMLLKRKHFSYIAANWRSKPENLREIAKSLNIGLDSLVLIDDNPVERAQVRAELPMVHVVELPSSPLEYLDAIREVPALDRPRVLTEDRKRSDMMKGDAERRQVEQQAISVEEFLRNLQMKAEVGLCNPSTLERIYQLIQKTNQFNLTTRRHRLEEIRRLAESSTARVAWLRLRDRYGDLGLVCVGILKNQDEYSWEIDTFLMSCRVMGRQVERAFLAYLAELARAAGGTQLQGIYTPTAKSQPVLDFYPQCGFLEMSPRESADRIYQIQLDDSALTWPSLVERVSMQEHAHG